jgi:leucyl aminopeptidase
MKFTFAKGYIEQAPAAYTRIRLVEEARGTKRVVREGDITWLEIGAGKGSEMNRRKFILLCRAIVRTAREFKAKKIALQFDKTPQLFKNLQDWSPEEISVTAATAYEMANYEHNAYKTAPKAGWCEVEEIRFSGLSYKSIEEAAKRGQIIGQMVNATRELSNTPGGDMTPKILAAAAKAAVKGTSAKVSVLGRKEMEKVGMGAVLGIAKGSAEEPQFIVMEYWGGGKKEQPVVFCGKGVTFDTGGLNIKPGEHMYEMHMDMSGGAAVMHAVVIAAKLKLKANVIALVPAVENSPGQNALRPGDILKSLSGKTIEILNTDAEGRVILADAIAYAKRYNPKIVVDVATLTGPSVFGQQASSVMMSDTNPKAIMEMFDMAESSGDYMWPLPLWEEFDYIVKGRFGDVPNIPAEGNSRWAGVIAGGKFLEVFAKDLACPWMHIDMGSRMTSAPNEFLAKGAAGAPVRFLLALIEKHAKRSAR